MGKLGEYPRRLSDVWKKLQRLREKELGWTGPNPSLNSNTMTDENYARLCGGMDSLLDMENALVKFLGRTSVGRVPSELECLGFLQALYIQQDSVREIFKSQGRDAEFNLSGGAKTVREIRNRVSGHAAFASQVKPPGSAMWAAKGITPEGFEMVIYYVKGSSHLRIDFVRCITENANELADLLEIVLSGLNVD